ncbi:LVIVD repeat-containing protein [Nitriliruptor alkaliphilus]|uniref:LVIVD repeat-containing protein n=1 Tax=Nitriliruptor alkaliphilus TaxID=427918 RepID=UPI000698FEAA|nr:hypothetical protein [Nitriliruptor alkaliphilus]
MRPSRSLRRSRLLVLAAAASLTAGFLPVGSIGLAAPSLTLADTPHNIEHVANIQYEDRYGTRPNQGSDLEFATIPVVTEVQAPRGNGKGKAPPRVVTTTEDRTFSFAGSYTNGLHIIDVTIPDEPELVAVYDCAIAQGDVQVFERDGRWLVAYTRDSGYAGATRTESTCFHEAEALGFGPAAELGPGTFIADVTDPTAPRTVSFVSFPKGSHNQTVHPSGDYLYNSNSELITSVVGEVGIEVFDIRDLSAPEQVAFLPLPIRPGLGTESHDITFNRDGTRAYSAALSQTVIIDTTDPAAPELISSIVDPMINVEHQSDPVTIVDPILGERDFLIIEDEFVGALGTGQCPNGGVHVYDITGDLEQDPVKVGYWNVALFGPTTNVTDSCTAHVFEIHEDEQLMTIAFYNGGVRVVDLSGLVGVALGDVGVGMREVASFRFEDANTWAVKAPSVDRDGVFHIYGNDQRRGFDAYEVDLSGGAENATTDGRDGWLTPEELELRVASLPAVDVTQADLFRCMLPSV